MSLDDKTQQSLDALQKELGFSGRSETIRQCIRMFASERKQSQKITGEIDGAIVVVHPDEYTEAVTKVRHTFQHIIKTQIHNHLENHVCFELFVVKGPAETVKKLVNTLQASRNVTLVKLLVV